MSQRDRAAVDVDAFGVDFERADRLQDDGGEGFVDLPEVDVAGAQASGALRHGNHLLPEGARGLRGPSANRGAESKLVHVFAGKALAGGDEVGAAPLWHLEVSVS